MSSNLCYILHIINHTSLMMCNAKGTRRGIEAMTPAGELRLLVLAAQREGNRLFAEQLRPLGLTPSQAEVIRVLYESQPLSLIELGEQLVCETGSPSRLVDGLVKVGIVERCPSSTDQRKVVLSLTERGSVLNESIGVIEGQFESLFAHIGDEATLTTTMETLWRFVVDKPAGEALARRLGRTSSTHEK